MPRWCIRAESRGLFAVYRDELVVVLGGDAQRLGVTCALR